MAQTGGKSTEGFALHDSGDHDQVAGALELDKSIAFVGAARAPGVGVGDVEGKNTVGAPLGSAAGENVSPKGSGKVQAAAAKMDSVGVKSGVPWREVDMGGSGVYMDAMQERVKVITAPNRSVL